MIHHVLVPLDGSQLAEKALPIARQVVRSGGEITLLTVVHSPAPLINIDPDEPIHVGDDAEYVQARVENAREYLEHTGKNLQLNGYDVHLEIAGGDPADAIIKASEEMHVGLIVMSTHGRSGLSRVLFGSITLKVLEASSIPVLVVPNREREEVKQPATAPDLGPDLAT
ncbi:MAG: universal stress protein UspA [Anaerolineaceae bacterium]|nr:universal stress protein UspA [Anaerolineaceae bacterium]